MELRMRQRMEGLEARIGGLEAPVASAVGQSMESRMHHPEQRMVVRRRDSSQPVRRIFRPADYTCGAAGLARSPLSLEDLSLLEKTLLLTGDDLHFMFSRKSVDALRVEGINHAITRMQNDGRLSAIMGKYLD